MSWNCWVRTSRHCAPSRCPSTSPAAASHSSASRSRRSHRRLPTFVRSWLVSVPRWVSKYSSPRHTGIGAPRRRSRPRPARRTPPGVPCSTCGMPRGWPPGAAARASRESARRHRRRTRTAATTTGSRRGRRSGARSTPAPPASTSALYVSTGGKCVSTRVPSMPSHQNVEWGNRFVRFHDSFWVTNRRIPPATKTCGRPAGYPKTSGIQTSRAASAEVRLEPALPLDDLPHDALAGRQVHVRFDPHATDRDPLSGRHLVGDAGEQLGLALGDPFVLLRLRAREAVAGIVVHHRHGGGERAGALADGLGRRPQPRRVDVGVTSSDDAVCVVARRRGQGRGDARRELPRRPRDAPRTSSACASRWRTRARRGSSSGSVRITPSSTSRSYSNASASVSTTTSSARSSRYSCLVPADSGDPMRDGRNCGKAGLAAASTTSTTGPGRRPAARPGGVGGCPAPGDPSRRARDPRTGTPGRPSGSRDRAALRPACRPTRREPPR